MEKKHIELEVMNHQIRQWTDLLKIKKHYLEVYHSTAENVNPPSENIKEIESEISETYELLQEEEELFASNIEQEGQRIDTIKQLLLKVRQLEEQRDAIASELKQKEKQRIKNDESKCFCYIIV